MLFTNFLLHTFSTGTFPLRPCKNQGCHHLHRLCVCVFLFVCHAGCASSTLLKESDTKTGRSTGRAREEKRSRNPFFFSHLLNVLSKHTPKYARPQPSVKERGGGNLERNERQPLSCHQLFLGPKAPAEERSHGGRARQRKRKRKEGERERDGSASNYRPCQGDGPIEEEEAMRGIVTRRTDLGVTSSPSRPLTPRFPLLLLPPPPPTSPPSVLVPPFFSPHFLPAVSSHFPRTPLFVTLSSPFVAPTPLPPPLPRPCACLSSTAEVNAT